MTDPLTPEQIKSIRSLRKKMTWKQIAESFGVSADRLRRQADPDYRDRQNRNAVERKLRKKCGETRWRNVAKEPPMPLMPNWSAPDTLIGRLMGDPALERSALAQRQQKV